MKKEIYNKLKKKVDRLELLINGGKGSGNFGHSGRPGEVGGSGDGAGASEGGADRLQGPAKTREEYVYKKASEKCQGDASDVYASLSEHAEWIADDGSFAEGYNADDYWKLADRLGVRGDKLGEQSRVYTQQDLVEGFKRLVKEVEPYGLLDGSSSNDKLDEFLGTYDFDRRNGLNGRVFENGGKGSGNFGHAGRPGEVGGSGRGVKASSLHSKGETSTSSEEKERSKALQASFESAALESQLRDKRFELKKRGLFDYYDYEDMRMDELVEDGATPVDLANQKLIDSIRREYDEKTQALKDEIEDLEKQVRAKYKVVDDYLEKYGKKNSFVTNGGKGSGNFGHSGRPGEVGGSGKGFSAGEKVEVSAGIFGSYEAKIVKKLKDSEKPVFSEEGEDYYEVSRTSHGSEVKGIVKSSDIKKKGANEKGKKEAKTQTVSLKGKSLYEKVHMIEAGDEVHITPKDNLPNFDRKIKVDYIQDGTIHYGSSETSDGYTYPAWAIKDITKIIRKKKNSIYAEVSRRLDKIEKMLNGGKGSGNFGHSGRPGEVGGSGNGKGNTKIAELESKIAQVEQDYADNRRTKIDMLKTKRALMEELSQARLEEASAKRKEEKGKEWSIPVSDKSKEWERSKNYKIEYCDSEALENFKDEFEGLSNEDAFEGLKSILETLPKDFDTNVTAKLGLSAGNGTVGRMPAKGSSVSRQVAGDYLLASMAKMHSRRDLSLDRTSDKRRFEAFRQVIDSPAGTYFDSDKLFDDTTYLRDTKKNSTIVNGGKGSGNFGHAGRPGEVGGSSKDGGGMNPNTKIARDLAKQKEYIEKAKQVTKDIEDRIGQKMKEGETYTAFDEAKFSRFKFFHGEDGTEYTYDKIADMITKTNPKTGDQEVVTKQKKDYGSERSGVSKRDGHQIASEFADLSAELETARTNLKMLKEDKGKAYKDLSGRNTFMDRSSEISRSLHYAEALGKSKMSKETKKLVKEMEKELRSIRDEYDKLGTDKYFDPDLNHEN